MSEALVDEHSQAVASASDVATNTAAIAANTAAIAAANTANSFVTATTHVYVATTGNDSNAGTIAAPKATLAGAYALLPKFLAGAFVVHFATGTYNFATAPAHAEDTQAGFIVLIGDGASQAGDDGFTTMSTGTANTGSSLGTFVTTGGLTASALVGYTIEITSGAAVGCRRLINENTTTDINLDYPLTDSSGTAVSAASGVTYRIIKPAVTFTTSAVTTVGGYTPLSYGRAVHLVQCRTSGNIGTQGTRMTCFYGVELGGTCMLSGPAAAGMLTYPVSTAKSCSNELPWETQNAIVTAAGLTGNTLKWEGWGVSDSTGTLGGMFNGVFNALIAGYFVGKAAFIAVGAAKAFIAMLGGRLQAVRANTSGAVYFSGNTNTPTILNGTTLSCLSYLGNEVTVFVVTNLTVIQSGDFPAITLSGLSCLKVSDAITLTITHTATSNPCISVTQKASIQCGGTITGTTNRNVLDMQNSSVVSCTTLSFTQGLPSTMVDKSHLETTTCVLTGATGAALAMADGSVFVNKSTATLTCTASGTGAVTMTGTCRANFKSTTTITNSSTAASSDGIVIKGGAAAYFGANPAISTTGSSGYACNLRGGGQAFFAVSPTSVVGVTADFSVASGNDFSRTSLASSLTAVTSGLSGAARST